ncbi:MAG: BON domain-containing protein [Acidobacteriia bacterium]|nr:BON domain-containing protein [Terriglobia bacterium]
MAAALAASVGVAGAAKKDRVVLTGDAGIEQSVRHEIVMYPRYSIWDDISFRVVNGSVELMGAVSQPYKKQDIERLVQRIPGVASVTDEIKVLPLSSFDDRLRIQIARAIYRDPALSRYAIQAVPPIHIIVDNGHVTLAGVVNNELEKEVAGMRASSAGLSFGAVTNNLQVENPKGKKS